jgi:cytochrome c oxidase cbb3-type subunit I/II
MLEPTSMSPGSIMPNYAWMLDDDLDTSTTAAKIRAMQTLGVPYLHGYDQIANKDLMHQADSIVKNLADAGIKTVPTKEIVAMIAYLQRMGTDIKMK